MNLARLPDRNSINKTHLYVDILLTKYQKTNFKNTNYDIKNIKKRYISTQHTIKHY